MNTYSRRIRPFVSAELAAAARAQRPRAGFTHLERAHVLGQASTREHVRVHLHMLVWALRNRDMREVLGQMFRSIGAAALTGVGLIPAGNTGGSNVNPFKPMAIAPDLAALMAVARHPQ